MTRAVDRTWTALALAGWVLLAAAVYRLEHALRELTATVDDQLVTRAEAALTVWGEHERTQLDEDTTP